MAEIVEKMTVDFYLSEGELKRLNDLLQHYRKGGRLKGATVKTLFNSLISAGHGILINTRLSWAEYGAGLIDRDEMQRRIDEGLVKEDTEEDFEEDFEPEEIGEE